MNEDDTFKRLKRMPFKRVDDLLMKRGMSWEGDPSCQEWFADHGWTVEEYINARCPNGAPSTDPRLPRTSAATIIERINAGKQ
jgi:hypothetical protein